MLYYKILDIKDFDCINIKKLFLLLLINIYKNSNNNLMLKDKSSIIKNPLLFYDINNYKYDFDIGKKDSQNGWHKVSLSLNYDIILDTFSSEFNNFFAESPSFSFLKSDLNSRHSEIKNKKQCIILVHGYNSKNRWLYINLAENFKKFGIDSIIYTLPFHLERATVTLNPVDVLNFNDFRILVELFRRAVIELRILINMLKQNGYDEVACMGFSVGGYITGVLAGNEKNLDYCFCLASGGDYPVLFNYYGKKDNQNLKKLDQGYKNDINEDLDLKNNFDNSNINLYFVKKYSHLIAPITYKCMVDKNNVIFFNGIFDTRVSFKSALRLKNAWGNPRIVVYPCGHFTFFFFNGITQRIIVNHLLKDKNKQKTFK